MAKKWLEMVVKRPFISLLLFETPSIIKLCIDYNSNYTHTFAAFHAQVLLHQLINFWNISFVREHLKHLNETHEIPLPRIYAIR